ncbi:hypothetical protein [Sedimentitalea nanhaiensis]|uniref:Uncharacterized protein n=1 Tax=Sedimentitalea nanhaiensis TaxID=999627 RepID=A0A1I6ZGQ9_9RHOB|nr:hypothetical protein [Sedimentitalea nanhaiensis]SFT61886.1 hypothetical protein SAMN05216236_104100 [Sedimentitalea nanhaiensis]
MTGRRISGAFVRLTASFTLPDAPRMFALIDPEWRATGTGESE